jgi:hypothetical protein
MFDTKTPYLPYPIDYFIILLQNAFLWINLLFLQIILFF